MESAEPTEPFDDALFDYLFDPAESDRKRQPAQPAKEAEQGSVDADAPESSVASVSVPRI